MACSRTDERMRNKVSSHRDKHIRISKSSRRTGSHRATWISLALLLFAGACRVEPEPSGHGHEVNIVKQPIRGAIAAEKTLGKSTRMAAEQGNSKAQYDLGTMYFKGVGVSKDDAEAVQWYRKAAKQKYADAQFSLGEMYYHGNGVTQDYGEAERWYRMAAEQGIVLAQYSLGKIYAKGEGVTQDMYKAYVWYTLAAIRDPSFANLRDDARNNLAADAVLKAQRKAFKLHKTISTR